MLKEKESVLRKKEMNNGARKYPSITSWKWTASQTNKRRRKETNKQTKKGKNEQINKQTNRGEASSL